MTTRRAFLLGLMAAPAVAAVPTTIANVDASSDNDWVVVGDLGDLHLHYASGITYQFEFCCHKTTISVRRCDLEKHRAQPPRPRAIEMECAERGLDWSEVIKAKSYAL